MKKALLALTVVVVSLGALFFIIPLFLPTSYSVEVSSAMNAPQKEVFNYVRNLETFDQWSPWAELDPEMKIETSGEAGEIGSSYSWQGNEDVGKGKMTISNISDNRIDINLQFIEPWESESKTWYVVEEVGNTSIVYWYMTGEMSYPWNIMSLFMNMEEMISKDYYKGLNKLKTIVEDPSFIKQSFTIESIYFEPHVYYGNKKWVDKSEMSSYFQNEFNVLYTSLSTHSKDIASPSALFFVWEHESQETEMAAVISTHDFTGELDGFERHTLSGRALRIAYYGDYEGSENAHKAMEEHIKKNNIRIKSPVIEEYVTDPGQEPNPEKWLTNIYYFIED